MKVFRNGKRIILFLTAIIFYATTNLICCAGPPAIGVLYITGDNYAANSDCEEAISSNLGQLKSVYSVERIKLSEVFSEQMLKYDGIVETLSDDSFQAIGLDYVIIGSLDTSCSLEARETKHPFYKSTVIVNLRLVDARKEIGKVIWSGQDTSECFDKNPNVAINEAVYDCIRQMYDLFPITGTVIKSQEYDNKVYVDIGTDLGIRKGDTLFTKAYGDYVYSPNSGKMISVGDDNVKLKVTQIYKDYCIAEYDNDENNTKYIHVGTGIIKKLHSKPRDWLGVWSRKVIF